MPKDRVCRKCSLSIDPNADLYTVCEGDCACFFHAACVCLSEKDLCVLSSNIVWMCDDCMGRFRRVRDGVASDVPDDTTANNEINKSSIEDEVKELKNTVAGIIETLSKMVPAASTNDPPPVHSTPVSSFTLLNGTNACGTSMEDNESASESVRQRRRTIDDQHFSLLLTNIDASVVEDDIHGMVSQALGIGEHDPECIDIVKLVSNWKSQKILDYVSFKIVLHKRWKLKAMNPSTWPKSVKFREFINRHNDTWKPLF